MVYFVQRLDGLIKIGYSGFVAVRMQDLATEHGTLKLLAVINGKAQIERRHHERFAAHRVVGEWFAPCRELTDYIGTIVSREPPRTFTPRASQKPLGAPRGRRFSVAACQGALARALAREE